MNPPVKLLDLVRQRIRLKGYSIRTEKSYTEWIRRYILFHGKQHPKEMGKTVMTPDETRWVISAMRGVHQLMAEILYGCGLRVLECVRLRVKDVDFAMNQIMVRDGKGAKDRINADTSWGWQYVFPAGKRSVDPRPGILRRHHAHETGVRRALKQAAEMAGIDKPISCHTLRHSFATDLLANGYDIRTLQDLLGHKDVSTTMIYTHVLNRGGKGVVSPLDAR